MALLPLDSTPTDVAELILRNTVSLRETSKKLAESPFGTEAGREQAGKTSEAINTFNTEILIAMKKFQQTFTGESQKIESSY